MTGTVGHGPLIQDGEGGNNGIDQVNTDEDTGFVALREEGEKATADNAGNSAEGVPGPAVRGSADTKADEEGEEDTDNSGGHVEKGGDGAGVSKPGDESGGVGGYNTARNRDLARG